MRSAYCVLRHSKGWAASCFETAASPPPQHEERRGLMPELLAQQRAQHVGTVVGPGHARTVTKLKKSRVENARLRASKLNKKCGRQIAKNAAGKLRVEEDLIAMTPLSGARPWDLHVEA